MSSKAVAKNPSETATLQYPKSNHPSANPNKNYKHQQMQT